VSEVTGGGSTMAKHRAAEKIVAARAPLIRALRSWPSGECIMDSRTPPLRLKVERRGGVRMIFTAVDPGALIWAVGEMHPRFRTPPPLLKGRKARGVRILLCAVDLGAQIRTARSCLLFTTGASSPKTLDKWVLTHSFDF
jgi:hypothetical protein